MIARAIARHVRTTPQKARFVTRTIVGLPVPQAMTQLAHAQKRAAGYIAKALKSAASNAKQAGADPQELVVSRAVVNEGATWKRFRAAAMGRATPVRKRTSHILVELDSRTAVQQTKRSRRK